MNHLPEYISQHLTLVIATVVAALVALVFELRSRSLSATAISANTTIALQNKGALILDVRSAEEFAGGHIVDAKNIELDKLSEQVESLKKWREKPVIVCCESGARSAQAAKLLKSLGFAQVANLQGGLASWRSDNLPLTKKSK
jgi:rhodanese-related sulfurtransferase